VLLVGAACALIASRPAYETVDYSTDAGPAIDALTHLDAGRFFASEPQMGILSLLLRWPFAALARLGDGGELDEYRLGAFACVFVSGLVGLLLAREMHRLWRGAIAIGLTLGLWLLNPATLQAINIGHPEEVLGGALCVVAVLTGTRGRSVVSGVSLGLALATKQWALVAIAPTLLGSRNPLKTGAIAMAIWLPLELVLVLGNFHAYERVGHFGVVVGTPTGAWWPFVGILPTEFIERAARPFVLAAALAVSVVAWRRGGPRGPESEFALLALLLLLRALLDPTGNQYFAVPFLMALLAFEGLRSPRPPLVSMTAVVMLAVTFHSVTLLSSSSLTNLVYLAWALPLCVYLWLAVDGRPVMARLLRSPADNASRP
jgi:hypothetical protein